MNRTSTKVVARIQSFRPTNLVSESLTLHGSPCSATRENLNKTLVKNDNPKFSYRNNENYEIHHGRFSNKHVELVYTKYEVKRSIIKEGGCIQPFNPVFDTLTVALFFVWGRHPAGRGNVFGVFLIKQKLAKLLSQAVETRQH